MILKWNIGVLFLWYPTTCQNPTHTNTHTHTPKTHTRTHTHTHKRTHTVHFWILLVDERVYQLVDGYLWVYYFIFSDRLLPRQRPRLSAWVQSTQYRSNNLHTEILDKPILDTHNTFSRVWEADPQVSLHLLSSNNSVTDLIWKVWKLYWSVNVRGKNFANIFISSNHSQAHAWPQPKFRLH